jgi:uncharacterized protein YaiE (UPF0345 family)
MGPGFLRVGGGGIAGNVYINGNVGIRTANPGYSLDVSGEMRVGSGVGGFINLGQAGVGGGFRSAYINSTSTDLTIMNRQPGVFNFGTNNDEKMRITATGRVGIGTSNPGYLLDVSGGGAHIQTTDPQLTIRTNRPVYNASKAAIQFHTSEGTNPMGRIECLDRSTGNSVFQNDMIFYSGFNVTNVERMRILANGNVGIGTNAPEQLLEVKGAVAAGTNTQVDITSMAGGSTSTNTSTLNLKMQGAGGGIVNNKIIGKLIGGGYGFQFSPMDTNVMQITSDGSMTVGGSNGSISPFVSFTSKKYSTTAIGHVNAFSIAISGLYGATYLEVIVMGTYSGVEANCIRYELGISPGASGATNLIYTGGVTVASGNNIPKTQTVIPGGFELKQTSSGKTTTFAVYNPAATNDYSVYVRTLAGGVTNVTITML